MAIEIKKEFDEKENLLENKEFSYKSDDDIENQNSDIASATQAGGGQNIVKNQDKSDYYLCKSRSNLICLMLLFLTLVVPLVYFLLRGEKEEFYNFFQPKTIHLKIKSEVFLISWLSVIFASTLSAIRFLCVSGDPGPLYIKNVITKGYGFLFIIAVMATTASLINWAILFSEKNGIILSLQVLSNICYFIIYTRIKNFKIMGMFDILGLDMPVCFLFAFSNYLFIVSFFKFAELNFSLTEDNLQFIGICIQCAICLMTVLTITYHKDMFYVMFILLLQIGIVLEKQKKSTAEMNFNIVIAVFTAICFIFSFCVDKGPQPQNTEKELMKSYENENLNTKIF